MSMNEDVLELREINSKLNDLVGMQKKMLSNIYDGGILSVHSDVWSFSEIMLFTGLPRGILKNIVIKENFPKPINFIEEVNSQLRSLPNSLGRVKEYKIEENIYTQRWYKKLVLNYFGIEQ